MSVTGNSVFPLPEADAAELCKRMGLALGNAAMYGMEHAVTVNAQNTAFDMLVGLLDLYGEVEWSLLEDGLLINGKSVDVGRGTAQVLIDQLRRGGINNFAICPPLERREFTTFLSILSAEPNSPLVSEGVETAVVKANLKSVRVDKAVYERVGSQSAKKKGDVSGSSGKGDSSGRGDAKPAGKREEKGRVFDLDSDLMTLGDDEGLDGLLGTSSHSLKITSKVAQYAQHRAEMVREHNELVDVVRECGDDEESLEALRAQLAESGVSAAEWRMLLAESGIVKALRTEDAAIKKLLNRIDELAAKRSEEGADVDQRMTEVLDGISHELDSLINHTQGQASSLAQRLDADRETVARIEQGARESGVGLQLSREELLGSLAEINQELAQPLTTSSAMLQMLAGGRMGTLTVGQQDVLKTVTDGMTRLEQLISYLQRISGLPVELSPDHGLLSEVYEKR